ncbi:hypothetical protein AMAG_12702 [Allomyces macrogynus ATCC 38327]|uniref:BZIP domain-containing protein n=1 Tax=Allomyces macrogynus (strain ATCC 38327) TaxID=578462 RepID=A0A0L0T148_ALLM3|nr:hypothetical protein AMAG_12702 [Allomyces macrogynus ATCC 38327]|eukprot:KNE68533.1 hypothetical protein AMAG_12702 [Allomyces macrogynus ATCC 38327]
MATMSVTPVKSGALRAGSSKSVASRGTAAASAPSSDSAATPTISLNSRKSAVNCSTVPREREWPKGFIPPTAPIKPVRGSMGSENPANAIELTEEAISQLPEHERKRIRNTISARLSRARKEARVQALEEEYQVLSEKLEMTEQQYNEAMVRIRELEEQLRWSQ